MRTFRVGSAEVGGGQLTIIAGPCMAESYEVCAQVAEKVQQLCSSIGAHYIFKASYDKANRSSGGTSRGLGLQEGLRLIEKIKDEFGIPATTDIHLPSEAQAAAQAVELLQIPAFLCRQSDLLEAAAQTGRPVNVKKGQFLAPWDCKNIVDKLDSFGSSGTMLTERGTTFGYNTLIVDMPGLETMREFGVPICFDATHSAQRPGAGGTVTGGVRQSIPAMTRAALAVGIDALFLEIHPDPDRALSDSSTQWPLSKAEQLFKEIQVFEAASRTLK